MANIKAIELAEQFRGRANERQGSIWLSAKQINFLASLASPVSRDCDLRGVGPVVKEIVHGGLEIHAYFADGEQWTARVSRNGAGLFQAEIGYGREVRA